MLRTFRWLLLATSLATATLVWAASPEGVDGAVYSNDNLRFLTKRAGYWDPWTFGGSSGRPQGARELSSAEAEAIERNLKRIYALVLATPTGGNPVGFHGKVDPGWDRPWIKRGAGPSPAPISYSLGIFPFDMYEYRRKGESWRLEVGGETQAVYISANSISLLRLQGRVFTQERLDPKEARQREPVRIYTRAAPIGAFAGFPVYSGQVTESNARISLLITRPSREAWKPATIDQVLSIMLPQARDARDRAVKRLADNVKHWETVRSPAWAEAELAQFEKKTGADRLAAYPSLRGRELHLIERTVQDADVAAHPARGTPEGRWYWQDAVNYDDAVKRFAEMSPAEKTAAACARPDPVAGSGMFPTAAWALVDRAGIPGCEPLVVENPDYVDRSLPRTAIQLLAVEHVWGACVDFRKGQEVPARGLTEHVGAGGCKAVYKILQELDWKALAAMMAP